MSTPRTNESRSQQTPKADRVLAAGIELFAERGFHGTTVPMILEKAGVGASSLYRRFASKEALVNAVFRDAKGRLAAALREGDGPGVTSDAPARAIFDAFWARLVGFARREPVAFRFLELQDHAPYLDAASRAVEMTVLAPIVVAVLDFQRRGVIRREVPPETLLAFVWGAFVGLFKAERTHGVAVTDASLAAARDACWRAFAAPDHADSARPTRMTEGR
jgi:AcrR family transcriptional regulator